MVIGQKTDKKKIIKIVVAILLVFLITIIIVKVSQNNKQRRYLEQEQQRVKQYTSLQEFKTMQEVALYLDCNFIEQKQSEQENIEYEIIMELPVNLSENKNYNVFFEKLMQYSAYVLKYKNFSIIDEKNNIQLVVYCDEENEKIVTYAINGKQNYLSYIDSKINIQNFNNIEQIQMQISSKELQSIIKNNWVVEENEIGTVETTYRNYDIYFEEGIEVRKVNGKVFNIVFTKNYQDNVINNLKTNSTKEEIEKNLGKPQFEAGELIGYKGEKLYAFFYNNQISIYRIEDYNTDKIAQILEQYKTGDDVKALINSIKNEWKDYDEYSYDTNYVTLKYTLKGLVINFNSNEKKGAIFYNNYKGFAYGNTTLQEIIENKLDIPDNICIENKDLVYEHEINRINSQDDTTPSNNNAVEGVLNISNEFKVYSKKLKKASSYTIRFISINNKYPSSELRETIQNGIWYDDYNFIYSVSKRGIFVYNIKDRTYKTIVNGNENYVIKKIENNLLYYDETSVAVNI